MQQLFQSVLNTYLLDNSIKVNSNKDYHNLVVNSIPEKLLEIVGRNKYLVKGSCGQGNKAKIPWVCIFNEAITKSASYGLYIVYLFKADMSGFYLSLSQGITYFNKIFGDDGHEVADYVSHVINESINQSYFSPQQINLNARLNKLAVGYEKVTIFSKFYPSNKFNTSEIYFDLKKMLQIYDQAYALFSYTDYDTFIEDILNGKFGSVSGEDYMTNEIVDAVIRESEIKSGQVITLKYFPSDQIKSPKFPDNVGKKANKKVDYIAKAKKNTATGLLGEKAVMDYEKQCLININRSDLADQVKWLSKKSDIYGYDILSFNVETDGTIQKKYIEVKSTTNRKDTIVYFSQNEINKSIKLAKNYWVYRVINLYDGNAYFYSMQGSIEENFDIRPVNYIGVKKS